MNSLDEQTARGPLAGVWSLDVDARRMTWSAGMWQIHDFPPDPSPIGLWEALAFLDRQDRPRVFFAAMDCLCSGIPIELEVRLTTAAGRSKRVRVSGFRAAHGTMPMLKGTLHELPLDHAEGAKRTPVHAPPDPEATGQPEQRGQQSAS